MLANTRCNTDAISDSACVAFPHLSQEGHEPFLGHGGTFRHHLRGYVPVWSWLVHGVVAIPPGKTKNNINATRKCIVTLIFSVGESFTEGKTRQPELRDTWVGAYECKRVLSPEKHRLVNTGALTTRTIALDVLLWTPGRIPIASTYVFYTAVVPLHSSFLYRYIQASTFNLQAPGHPFHFWNVYRR